MLHLFRSIALAALAVVAFQGYAEESNPARQASEIEPTESQRGETANRGPRKFGEEEAVVEKKEEKSEKKEKKEKKNKKEKKEKAENVEGKESACATCGKEACACGAKAGDACTACLEATVSTTTQQSELAKADFDRKMRAAIRKLSTSGWREAQIELIDGGKAAVPYLIDAMAAKDEEGARPHAYNLGGHTKADAGRAPRQRSVAEVASELLTSMVSNHSSYKGELPAADQKAWQEWWIANGESVTCSK